MKILQNEMLQIVGMKIRTFKGWRIILTFILVLSYGAAPAQAVLADAGGVKGHSFDVTFTKWVITLPANPSTLAGVLMIGVVGGDVGEGRYAGQVLSDDSSVPGFWSAHARYEFHGEKHSFIADVHVRENDTTNPATAVVTGIITSGWLKGAHVSGGYTVMNVCPMPTPGNVFGTVCFQGSLHITRSFER